MALSTTEAKYYGLGATCCQAIYVKQVLQDYGVILEEPIVINCDSKACMSIAKNPVLHNRTKHISIKYHFVRELVQNQVVQLCFCRSEEQLADIFTKCLVAQSFCKSRSQLGICKLQSRKRVLEDD